MPQQQRRNGNQSENNQTESEVIRDFHDVQGKILASSQSNPLLRETNLGLGKYDDDYKWQQIRSYRKGLYAWIAFGRALNQRRIYETKMKLGEEGYNAIYHDLEADVKTYTPFDEDEDKEDDQSIWTAIRRRGEKIWKQLGDPEEVLTDAQLSALHDKTGIAEEWKPIFWELVSGRHEMSRSDEAELLRDALTGVKEFREGDTEDDSLL